MDTDTRQDHRTSSDTVWHTKAPEDIFAALESSPDGLEEDDAAQRLAAYGPNSLPAGKERSPLIRFLLQFHNILIYVLIGAAGITFFLGHMVDTTVILAVVVINAFIGFIQEGKAEQAIRAIRHMLAPHAAVFRGGRRQTIDGEKLVPGDIVFIEAGDKVPADLRLFSAHNLQIQEAILTGESVPVEKKTPAVDAGVPLGDRFCMAYSGTLVTAGQGRGVVIATGRKTEIGRISTMLSGVETLTTPLIMQINRFARHLTVFILGMALLLLAFSYFMTSYSFSEMFMVVVGLSVAAIPEGLPAVLTITLSIGVQAMARRHAIIRRLPVIETLGSVSVICTDKTGTLTRNEMMVATAITSGGACTVTGNGYEPEGTIHKTDGRDTAAAMTGNSILAEMARAAALCNDATLALDESGVWNVQGDPMEGALLTFSGKSGFGREALFTVQERLHVIPFDSRHRYMATLHKGENGSADNVVYIKGAPEKILDMCKDQRSDDGSAAPLNRPYWDTQAEKTAAQGQRLLALATCPAAAEQDVIKQGDLDGNLTLIGMVGMIDPPRPEAVEAVTECRQAGIRVKMITGDHAVTAMAIGRMIGLDNTDHVLTGADIEAMDDNALTDAAEKTDIFARTSPEHKLRLVTALQSRGHVVAMTGDGVNDAPALKRADAGIAMGRKGSEAAKEAAEFVLTDDNFASIVAAIREGRTVYDNIKKLISWTLPTNGGEAATIIVALLLGATLPVTPVQILWINLVTASTLGIALAFEPTEDGTMRRPPRKRNEPLLGRELIWHIGLVSFLFTGGVFGIYSYAMNQGYSIEMARTLAVNTLVVMEIFHLFFIRNIYGTSLTWKAVRGTKVIWLTVATVTAVQFLFTYTPFMQAVFATESVYFHDGLIVVAIGVALFAVIETEKQIRLRGRKQRIAGEKGGPPC